MAGLLPDPRERYTPLRRVRTIVTGDPLNPRDQERLEMLRQTFGTPQGVPAAGAPTDARMAEQFQYLERLRDKYGVDK